MCSMLLATLLALHATAGAADCRPRALDRLPASQSTWPSDSAEVFATVRRFLTAFEGLDWPAFRASFEDSATVFHPAADMAERIQGRAAIDSTFGRVFAEIRKAAPRGPPFQHLPPLDLRIASLGPGLALVTFHLRNDGRLGRRSLILHRAGRVWRIVHLHASNIPRATLRP